MKRISVRRALPIVIVLMAAMIAIPALAGDLAPKFKPGDKSSYVQTMDLTMSLTMFGSTLGEAKTTRTIAFDREILKKDSEGHNRMQITIKSVQIEETAPGETPVSYDSTKAADPSTPEQHLYAQLLKKPVIVVLNDKMDVFKIEGSDEILAAAKAKLTAPEDKDALQSEFDSLFADTKDIGALVNVRDIDPEKKVKPGDSWEKIWGGEMVDADRMTALITLKSKEGDISTVDYSVKTDELKKMLETPANPGDPPTKVDRLKIEGNVDFNTKKGRVQKSTDLIDMAMSVGEGDQVMMSMSITATINLQAK